MTREKLEERLEKLNQMIQAIETGEAQAKCFVLAIDTERGKNNPYRGREVILSNDVWVTPEDIKPILEKQRAAVLRKLTANRKQRITSLAELK